jgi:hypothetical protein
MGRYKPQQTFPQIQPGFTSMQTRFGAYGLALNKAEVAGHLRSFWRLLGYHEDFYA